MLLTPFFPITLPYYLLNDNNRFDNTVCRTLLQSPVVPSNSIVMWFPSIDICKRQYESQLNCTIVWSHYLTEITAVGNITRGNFEGLVDIAGIGVSSDLPPHHPRSPLTSPLGPAGTSYSTGLRPAQPPISPLGPAGPVGTSYARVFPKKGFSPAVYLATSLAAVVMGTTRVPRYGR